MNYHILIAEDEPKIREVLCDFFASRGDIPVPAADGAQALELAESQEFDGVLLDIMMPKLDGLTVCRCLRKRSDVPIIFLTALSDEEDKLYGYELGADDYVTKPFTMTVLYAVYILTWIVTATAEILYFARCYKKVDFSGKRELPQTAADESFRNL